MTDPASREPEVAEYARAARLKIMETLSIVLQELDRLGLHRPAALVQHAHDLIEGEIAP